MIVRGTKLGLIAGAKATASSNPAVTVGITLVHGLLSRKGCWADRMMKYLRDNNLADASSLEYWEGLFSLGHSGNLKKLIKLLHDELAKFPESQQHAVGHSNGCRLLLEALVQDETIKLDDLHLIAAWVDRDCQKHINILIARKQVKRIFLYTSKKDDALGWNIMLPQYWGMTMGKDGPLHAYPWPIVKAFDDVDPETSYPLTQVVDDTQTHCSWVDGDGGFSQRMAEKIMQISLRQAA